MGKDGKPLAGAAKTSFMKKCMHDSCEAKAVSADGKKLSGAAKTASMKKCEAGELVRFPQDIQCKRAAARAALCLPSTKVQVLPVWPQASSQS